jgi:hypothetical protein
MDSQRRRELQELLWRGGRWVVYCLLAATALWMVGSVLFGLGRGKPETAAGVLQRATTKDPGSYVMEYQVLRRITYDTDELETGFHANVQVDAKSDAYVMDMVGATLDGRPLHVQHAKSMTIYTTPSFGDQWIEAPELTTAQLTRFKPKELQSMKPKLLRDTGQYRSVKSWVLSVKPSGDALADMLWANRLNMTGSTAAKETEALRNGDFTLDWAYVWVGYESERILSVDLKFKINKGAEYRMRIKYGAWGVPNLSKLSFRENKSLIDSNTKVPSSSGDDQSAVPQVDPTDPDAIDKAEGDL